MTTTVPTSDLWGMRLARIGMEALLDHLFAALAAGRGGWLITANLDFLRRHVIDPEARALYDGADLCVADGMPLVWAARLQGDSVPERVAGSTLVPLLAERAAREGRSLYLLGGTSTANAGALRELARRWPTLRLVGSSPMVSSPPTESEMTALVHEIERATPDVLLVGLGSPKQELVIRALRARMSTAWMIGVGISFGFLAGEVRRAPAWMQRSGLEWLHRLAQEPRRLGRRYLLEDLPFAARLFAHALRTRAARR